MGRFGVALTILGLALVITGCASDKAAVVLTEAYDGGIVDVARGDEVDVILAGTESVGDHWEVAETDVSRLPLVDSSYSTSGDAPGSPGEFRFKFNAVASGEVHLRLRDVFRGSEVTKTFTVTIRIS
jgi:predicted secreted protein